MTITHCPRCGTALNDEVPNAPLREAFERSGLTPHELAARVHWYDRGSPDAHEVRRVLGLYAHPGRVTRTTLRSGEALVLAEALGLTPLEVGL